MRYHPFADCDNCPLQVGGKFVSSVGPETAEIAVIGEAPTAMDVRNGGGLITGPAGKLLDTVFKHHGIDKNECFLTTATLCRPADGSAPPKSAINACRPRLLAEVAEHGCNIAIALGNSAALAIYGQEKVTQIRMGPAKASPYIEGLRVIPTVHPAACLRQSDQFPNLITDIGKVKNAPPIWEEPKYLVTGEDFDALELIAAIEDRTSNDLPVVIDIEVDIEKDTAFDHPNHYGMLCVGIAYSRDAAVVISEEDMARQDVREALRRLLKSRRIGGQNIKFDLAGLYPILGPLEAWFDTMLASYTFDERPGIHGLEYQATEYIGSPNWKGVLDKYVDSKSGYGNVPRPILYKYNAYDCVNTYRLIDYYLERFKNDPDGEELRRVHDHLVRAANQLMYVELNGFTVDKEYLKELDVTFSGELEQLRAELDKIVAPNNYDKRGGINPGSWMQVKKALADMHVVVDNTQADTLTTALEQLQLRDSNPQAEIFLEKKLEYADKAKAYSTYVKGIEKRLYRGRVYSTYLLHGTTTGRLASRNPNMQNIPRDAKIRKLFTASKPGNILVHTDYSQAELRTLSFLAGDTYFRDIFNDGTKDVFDELTPVLYPHADKKKMTKAEWKELRIRVKAYVYGLSYGRSEYSIAMEYKIPVAEAKKGMDVFFSVIPEIVEFREQMRAKVLAGQDLVTPWGRHRRYALITKENVDSIMNEALAFLPQSTASDMCLQALTWTRPQLRGKAWIRNTIHDAILLECAEKDVPEVKAIVEANMLKSAETIVGDYVKFAVDTTTGWNWGEL